MGNVVYWCVQKERKMGLGKKYVVPTTETLHLMTMGSSLGELSI